MSASSGPAVRRSRPVSAGSPPPAPSGLTPRQRARREAIVGAAFELLGDRGYDRMQMKDVAEHAGVALGTVYHYFSSKEHLLATVAVEWELSLKSQIGRHPLRGSNNAERLTDALLRAVRGFSRRPAMYEVIMMMQTSTDPAAAAGLGQLSASTYETVGSALRDLAEDDRVAVLNIAMAVFDTLLREWTRGRITMVEVCDRLRTTVHVLLEFRSPD